MHDTYTRSIPFRVASDGGLDFAAILRQNAPLPSSPDKDGERIDGLVDLYFLERQVMLISADHATWLPYEPAILDGARRACKVHREVMVLVLVLVLVLVVVVVVVSQRAQSCHRICCKACRRARLSALWLHSSCLSASNLMLCHLQIVAEEEL